MPVAISLPPLLVRMQYSAVSGRHPGREGVPFAEIQNMYEMHKHNILYFIPMQSCRSSSYRKQSVAFALFFPRLFLPFG